MQLKLGWLWLFTLLSACTSKYSDKSDAELIQHASKMPLEKRYEFYLDVYRNTSPHRTAIAGEIASLGEDARVYTIRRGTKGRFYDELLPSLPVIAAFGQNCTRREYDLLLRAATATAPNKRELASARGRIRIACGFVNGRTWKDYQRAFDEP